MQAIDHLTPHCAGRLIVLDDERDIRNMLERYLVSQGFQVRTVKNSTQLDTQLERQPYDLLVLDVMLDGESGLSVCSRLRSAGQTIPILMLTARGDPVDRILGLETGADDYLAKPFVPSELVARIRAILRRQHILGKHGAPGSDAPADHDCLRFGRFRLDLKRQELVDGAAVVDLNSAELRLLCAMAATPNRPVSRMTLLERARGRGYEGHERSVDVQVLRLRQIIEDDAATPRHIRTIWGLGYMLIAAVDR